MNHASEGDSFGLILNENNIKCLHFLLNRITFKKEINLTSRLYISYNKARIIGNRICS